MKTGPPLKEKDRVPNWGKTQIKIGFTGQFKIQKCQNLSQFSTNTLSLKFRLIPKEENRDRRLLGCCYDINKDRDVWRRKQNCSVLLTAAAFRLSC